jgi:hypothetical protein
VVIGTYWSFNKAPDTNYVTHSQNILFWVPLILAASPGVAEYTILNLKKWISGSRSQVRIPNFGTQMIIATLALSYFSAGYCKLSADLMWADGDTLQVYILEKHLLLDIALGNFIAQSYWLCLLLGWATLVFELGFMVVIFATKLRPVFAVAGLLFHLGIFLAMDINFLTHMCLVYLIFLDLPSSAVGGP